MKHSVKISGVTKKFGSITALDNINMDITEASCVGLLGPNGAGKSTIMKSITNIIKPSIGRIEIDGISVSSNPKKALKSVGSLVEYPKFYPYLTGLESLYFVCRVKGLSKRECNDEIERVAKLTRAESYLDKKTGSYSRGMNQRVALSSALLCNPGILILDEPTFGLDPKGMKEMRELLTKINREGETIIMLSSHLIYEINEVCDRVVIVNGGKIAYDSLKPESDLWIVLTLKEIPEDQSLFSRYATEFRIEGRRVIMRKKEDVTNSEILRGLLDNDVLIDSFGEYDTLENIYISIVDQRIPVLQKAQLQVEITE